MEIKVNIPVNDYVQPTEIRQEVVQGICEAFLNMCVWSTFHPLSGGAYRNATRYIVRHSNSSEFYGFNHDASRFRGDVGIRFNGAEMKAAFDCLMSAGYCMFRVYEYGSWMGYQVRKKPVMERGQRVYQFDDFID